nr:MAG TPA: hypothetical protein [Caudoviricetes sp.]
MLGLSLRIHCADLIRCWCSCQIPISSVILFSE